MKRTNDNSYLIIIDGQECTGRNTLANWLKLNNENDFIICYFNEDDIYFDVKELHNKYPEKYIVVPYLFSDEITYHSIDDFEDLFNGNTITIIMTWDSFIDYEKRMKHLGYKDYDDIEDFNGIKDFYKHLADKNFYKQINVLAKDTPKDIYNKVERFFDSIF